MIALGGISPLSVISHIPMKPSVSLHHGDGGTSVRPVRGVSRSYAATYRKFDTATKIFPSLTCNCQGASTIPVFGPEIIACGATSPVSVRPKINRPLCAVLLVYEMLAATSRLRTGSTATPMTYSSFVLGPLIIRTGATSPFASQG